MNTLLIILTKIFEYIKSMILLSNNLDALAKGQCKLNSKVNDLSVDISSMKNHLSSLNTNYLELDKHGSKALVEFCKESHLQMKSINSALVNIDKRLVRVETRLNGSTHTDAIIGESVEG